jgi:hypothetical protein
MLNAGRTQQCPSAEIAVGIIEFEFLLGAAIFDLGEAKAPAARECR